MRRYRYLPTRGRGGFTKGRQHERHTGPQGQTPFTPSWGEDKREEWAKAVASCLKLAPIPSILWRYLVKRATWSHESIDWPDFYKAGRFGVGMESAVRERYEAEALPVLCAVGLLDKLASDDGPDCYLPMLPPDLDAAFRASIKPEGEALADYGQPATRLAVASGMALEAPSKPVTGRSRS